MRRAVQINESHKRKTYVGTFLYTHYDNEPKEDDIREIIPRLRES